MQFKLKYVALSVAALLLSATTAQAASVLFPYQGGTGTAAVPTYGQVLVGQPNGTYSPQATSTLGISGGSSFGYPFTTATNFGVTTAATSTPIWAQSGLFASSTSQFATSTVNNAEIFPMGSNGISLYNTQDQTTNYERLTIIPSSSVYRITSEQGGTGTSRPITFTQGGASSGQFTINMSNGVNGLFEFKRSTGGNGLSIINVDGSESNSSGNQTSIGVSNTIAQTGTASYTGLKITPTETTLGSGTHLLLQAGTSTNPDLFDVDNTGFASTTSFMIGSLRGNAAGTFLAADPTGKLIATTTPRTASSTLLSDNNTFGGSNTFTNQVAAVGGLTSNAQLNLIYSGPAVFMQNTGATTDNKNWVMGAGATDFSIYALNDAGTISGKFISATRSGGTIASVALPSLTNNGFVKTSGGTGTLSVSTAIAPGDISLTKGYFLVGNDAGIAQATSSIFISSTGAVTIAGTSITGFTGTVNSNIVLSASPTFTGTIIGQSLQLGAAVTAATSVIGTSMRVPLITGGNTVSSALTLESTSVAGTTDSIIFKTGSQATAMTIDTSGNVGIGTSTPTAALTVLAASSTVGTTPGFYSGMAASFGGLVAGVAKFFLQIDMWGYLWFGGDAPVLSACGTTPSVSGNQSTGQITVGTGIVNSCTATFAHPVAAGGTVHVFINEDVGSVTGCSAQSITNTGFNIICSGIGSAQFSYWVTVSH
jgi:hypothetical protein